MATTSGNDAWIENWLSADRFSTYLQAAGGFRKRALDRQLAAAVLPGDAHWTDPDTLLTLFPILMRRNKLTGRLHDVNKIPRSNVERARTSAATKPRTTPLPGKAVAEIMFGFWTYLLADSHEKTIWVPHLHKAFPLGTDRNRLNDSLASLRGFRNRVAHHENILNGSEGERRRIVYLVKLLSTDALEHLQTNSDVARILAKRP